MGRHLVSRFAREGWSVIAFDLPGCISPETAELCARVMEGNVLNGDDCKKACGNAEVIIHAAALLRDWDDKGQTWRVNVEGTENMLTAAVDAGIKRFILISSLAVHRYRSLDPAGDESLPRDAVRPSYALSKIRAEELVEQSSLQWYIVRPGLVPFGPHDKTFSWKVLAQLQKGWMPLVGSGDYRICTAYVENFVDALFRLVSFKLPSDIYIIADPWELTWRQLFRLFADELNVQVKYFSIPAGAAKILSRVIEKTWNRFSASEPPLTEYRVDVASNHLYFTSARLQSRLQWAPPVDLKEGVRRTVSWFLSSYG